LRDKISKYIIKIAINKVKYRYLIKMNNSEFIKIRKNKGGKLENE